MSFILDALRKSESERQRLSNASIADLPVGRRTRRQPWWIFALAALLLINLIVLVAVLMRDRLSSSSQSTPRAASTANVNATGGNIATNTNPSGATPINVASNTSNATPPQSDAATSPSTPSLAREATPSPQVSYETVPRSELEIANAGASVPEGPTLVKPLDTNANSNGANSANSNSTGALSAGPAPGTLQDLHIDLHVYSPNRRDSFVMINMRHYTEGQRLLEGPLLEQITPEGVVLSYHGTRYQLNRN